MQLVGAHKGDVGEIACIIDDDHKKMPFKLLVSGKNFSQTCWHSEEDIVLAPTSVNFSFVDIIGLAVEDKMAKINIDKCLSLNTATKKIRPRAGQLVVIKKSKCNSYFSEQYLKYFYFNFRSFEK